MQTEEKKIETRQVMTTSTYDTDCHRKIVNQETGQTEVKRWCEAR